MSKVGEVEATYVSLDSQIGPQIIGPQTVGPRTVGPRTVGPISLCRKWGRWKPLMFRCPMFTTNFPNYQSRHFAPLLKKIDKYKSKKIEEIKANKNKWPKQKCAIGRVQGWSDRGDFGRSLSYKFQFQKPIDFASLFSHSPATKIFAFSPSRLGAKLLTVELTKFCFA